MINELRKKCEGEVLTYTFLMDFLEGYSNPRDKITRMLKNKEIIRVKKGLYVFGEEYRRAPVSRPLLANLIYGPSYVSGLYALSQHGLIPERVEVVTCMTTQRNRWFSTPMGEFEYQYLNERRYTVGVDWRSIGEKEHCLFASPEKALADVVAKEKNFQTSEELLEFLVENMRIEEESLIALDLERMDKISAAYRNPTVFQLNTILERLT